MRVMITNHVSTFSRACPYKSAMLNLSRSAKYKIKTKLKLRFHRENVLSCCIICSLGVNCEFFEGTNYQSNWAVTKTVKIVQSCKNKEVSRKYNLLIKHFCIL